MWINLRELKCRGADGENRCFWLDGPTSNGSRHTYRVHLHNQPNLGDEWFEAAFETGDEQNSLRCHILNHKYYGHYRKMGIPEAVILTVAREKSCKIISSSTYNNGNQFRTVTATKVWERLVSGGKARQRTDGRYETL